MNFNKSSYQPNLKATREQAEQRLISLGYKNFSFKSCSFSNGASFYFEGENGEEIRVSDHFLTGRRAFTTIQVSLYEVKFLEPKVKKSTSTSTFTLTPEMIAEAAERKARRMAILGM